MEMETAKEIRKILDKIDYYNNRLREIKDCVKLNVTICDGYNGRPTTYNRQDLEVEAIIKAYENEIKILEHEIDVMRWVES